MEIGGGTLSTSLIGTYMLSKEYEDIPGVSEPYDCVDTLDNGCFPQPEWRHVLTASYDTGSWWKATAKWRYFIAVNDYTGSDTLVQALPVEIHGLVLFFKAILQRSMN